VAATDRPGGAGRRAGRGALRAGLATACTLLGVHAAPAQPVDVDSALLLYKEPSRVGVLEALIEARSEFGGGRTGSLKLVFDALSGASANGATPAATPQTFTGPSGTSSYTTPAGQTPLDNTFQDTRVALSGTYAVPLDRLTTAGIGLDLSNERDYTSLGGSGSLTRDFFKRNTTLSASVSLSHDTVRPMGGRPVPFDLMPPPGESDGEDDEEEEGNRPGTLGSAPKDVVGFIVGATQVVDRRTLVQVNYTYGHVSGYQTDPYKLLSVIDPATGDPTSYLYENRPDMRGRQAMFGLIKHHFGRGVLDLSYRYYWDTWGVRSHTGELHFRWGLGERRYLQPHLRYYKQTAADFYRRYLLSGEALPAEASADYRLGAFSARTVGLEYGQPLANGHLLTLRGEYYWQTGQDHIGEVVAPLRGFDLLPTVDAVIVQVGYSFSVR
jgi:hypothetical protein